MHNKNLRILFVGGGSGGHFYPLISIAEKINKVAPGVTLYYAGPTPYDDEALQKNNISFVYVPAGKQRRYRSLLNFFDLFVSAIGVFLSVLKLFIIYPDVVMSKGGYTSVPVVLAAAFLRIPIVIHESDSVPGRANLLASRFARHIVVAYDEAQSAFNHPSVHVLGIPIREVLLQPSTQNALQTLALDTTRPVILVLGGSQGAERINALILDSLDELLVDFTVLHQTGKALFATCTQTADALIQNPELRKHYHPTPFLNVEMLNASYDAARIIISRAGSNSIYEIALHSKPSIIIPIPETISHDQRSNAYAYARFGGAVVMEESNLTDGLLQSEINRIMQDAGIYKGMSEGAGRFGRRDAGEQTAALLIGVAQEH